MNVLQKLSIKQRLALNAVIIVIGMTVVAIIALLELDEIERLGKSAQKTALLETDMLTLRRYEKDFLSRHDRSYVQAFDKHVDEIKRDIENVRSDFDYFGLPLDELNALQSVIDRYQSTFKRVVSSRQVIGLHAQEGLRGQLHVSANELESQINTRQSYRLLADVLQLRRDEKDFMLHRDTNYLTQFNSDIGALKKDIEIAEFAPPLRETLLTLINDYQRTFENLVSREQEVGLNDTQGLLGNMHQTIRESEDQLKALLRQANENAATKKAELVVKLIGVVVAIILIALVALVVASRSIIAPINRSLELIRKVRAENDLRISIPNDNTDEVGELIAAINELTTEFHDLVASSSNSVKTLNEVAQTLAQNTENTGKHLEQQRRESDLVATAATEMQASIQEVSHNTHHAAHTAENTNLNAEEGRSEVKSTVQRIRALSEQINGAAQLVSELEKDSQTIGSVLDVIRGIAEQTNLLALNAAIEAARAGEQGRGFAVVADEVRNLAMRTQESTEEIETIISNLQNRTNSIVSTMNTCREDSLDSVTQIQHAGELLETISSEVGNIMDMNSQIATAVEEQATVAEEIGANVVRIRDVAEASSHDGQINAQQSSEVSALASRLHDDIKKYQI